MTPSRYASALSAAVILVAAPAQASHPRDFAAIMPPFMQAGDVGPAEHLFLKDANHGGNNQLLYLYEMASLYRMVGDTDKSIQLFGTADQVAHDYEGKAVVSAGGALGQVGATLTNDTVLPWEGSAFDKVMSRTLDAMNYLVKRDLEGARVEVKKAEEYQIQERERRAKDTKAADPSVIPNPAMSSKYQDMYAFAHNARNSYENAFTYFLSSQIYAAQGPSGLNDALVDIKRAYELAPAAPAVQAAYLDLAMENQDQAAVADLKGKLGLAPDYQPPDPMNTGTVVVVYEGGFVPPMSEVSINLPVSGKLFTMAFPIYNDFRFPVPSLRVQTPTGVLTTTKVADLRLMAVKALQERMPGILARGLVGAAAKVEAQKKVESQYGFFAGLAATVAAKVVTVADLRSWLSLPAEIQAAQFTLQPGHNEVTLAAYDWVEKVAVDVGPGSTTFLMVKAVPGCRSIKAATVTPGA